MQVQEWGPLCGPRRPSWQYRPAIHPLFILAGQRNKIRTSLAPSMQMQEEILEKVKADMIDTNVTVISYGFGFFFFGGYVYSLNS